MRGITSNSLRMMEKSMEFLWVKQAAHLDNISNAETPGYKVKTVTFEESFENRLRAAAKPGATRSSIRDVIEEAQWDVWEDEESVRYDENGVNVTEQSLESVRTAYQLQYVYQSINSDLARLNSAITG